MNIRIQGSLLLGALMLVALPAHAQSARIIIGGAAYGYADDLVITEGVVDQVVGAPAAQRGQVVFFRPGDAAGGDVALREGDVVVAELPRHSYCAVDVTPGTHTFVVDGRPLQLDLAPGERRYIRIDHHSAAPELVPSQALTFLRTSLGMRPPLI